MENTNPSDSQNLSMYCLRNFCSSEHCNDEDCMALKSYVRFLERKVEILEDIVNTTHSIAELNQSISDSLGSPKLTDISIQTEPVFICNEEVVYASNSNQSLETGPMSTSLLEENQCNPYLNEASTISSASLKFSTDNYSCISMSSCINDYTNEKNCNPVEIFDGSPFEKFSVESLYNELTFTDKFRNRETVYYGDYSYTYQGGHHKPKTIASGSYLSKICSYLKVLLPGYNYNSVLITHYKTGESHIPPHCDDEECIAEDSNIVTVSLGATRQVKYTDKSSDHCVCVADLSHGDMTVMSRESQNFYLHELVPDVNCSSKRLSLTFRLIKPGQTPDINTEDCGYVPYSPPSSITSSLMSLPFTESKLHRSMKPAAVARSKQKPTQVTGETSTIDTIYVSSSMFRNMNEKCLSSDNHRAKVFFFPGADSLEMADRLTRDREFINLPKERVKKIFLLTGTNYVDSVAQGSVPLSSALDGVDFLCSKLWSIFNNAQLYLINLLPRNNIKKNRIIDEINNFIKSLCNRHGLVYIDTEKKNSLFFNVKVGRRKAMFFKKGHDNVHLNEAGVRRLGKHLKYIAHNT